MINVEILAETAKRYKADILTNWQHYDLNRNYSLKFLDQEFQKVAIINNTTRQPFIFDSYHSALSAVAMLGMVKINRGTHGKF